MKLDQHDIATVTHAIIERVEKDMGPMNPMTMIGVREVIENHNYGRLTTSEPGRATYERVLRAFPNDPWESWQTLTAAGRAGWATVEDGRI